MTENAKRSALNASFSCQAMTLRIANDAKFPLNGPFRASAFRSFSSRGMKKHFKCRSFENQNKIKTS